MSLGGTGKLESERFCWVAGPLVPGVTYQDWLRETIKDTNPPPRVVHLYLKCLGAMGLWDPRLVKGNLDCQKACLSMGLWTKGKRPKEWVPFDKVWRFPEVVIEMVGPSYQVPCWIGLVVWDWKPWFLRLHGTSVIAGAAPHQRFWARPHAGAGLSYAMTHRDADLLESDEFRGRLRIHFTFFQLLKVKQLIKYTFYNWP